MCAGLMHLSWGIRWDIAIYHPPLPRQLGPRQPLPSRREPNARPSLLQTPSSSSGVGGWDQRTPGPWAFSHRPAPCGSPTRQEAAEEGWSLHLHPRPQGLSGVLLASGAAGERNGEEGLPGVRGLGPSLAVERGLPCRPAALAFPGTLGAACVSPAPPPPPSTTPGGSWPSEALCTGEGPGQKDLPPARLECKESAPPALLCRRRGGTGCPCAGARPWGSRLHSMPGRACRPLALRASPGAGLSPTCCMLMHVSCAPSPSAPPALPRSWCPSPCSVGGHAPVPAPRQTCLVSGGRGCGWGQDGGGGAWRRRSRKPLQ